MFPILLKQLILFNYLKERECLKIVQSSKLLNFTVVTITTCINFTIKPRQHKVYYKNFQRSYSNAHKFCTQNSCLFPVDKTLM